MNERVRPTKTGLFMTELLICVGVFSLCAAICVGLFVKSEVMSQDSANLNQAVIAAKNAAECYKAAGGDLRRAAELAGGEAADADVLFVEFDGNWQTLSPGQRGTFELSISRDASQGRGRAAAALLEVKQYTGGENEETGESLLVWNIAALEVRP